MENNNPNPNNATIEPQCAKCKEYEIEVGEYQILLLAITFIGPIIGMLIGLFAGKKLIGK